MENIPMINRSSKITIIGAGAIGGITGVHLRKAGYDVNLVVRNKETVEKISDEGFLVTGVNGTIQLPIPAFHSISQIKEKRDIIILATKTTDIVGPAKTALKIMHPDSILVSMQNGIVEEELEKIVGKKRLISCVVGWGATMIHPAHMEMTSKGEFVIGNFRGEKDERLEPLREILNEVIETKICRNMIGYLYSKLIINSCITSLGAISGMRLGAMLKQIRFRNLFFCIMKEAMMVAREMNVRVEKYAGKIDYYELTNPAGIMKKWLHHILLMIIGFKYRRLKSSSLQSLERGRFTEVNSLNGYIVQKAQEYGVPVPLNERIVSMIHEIEKHKKRSEIENLKEDILQRCGGNPEIHHYESNSKSG